VAENGSVVELGEYGEDEELAGTCRMPFLVAFASVYVGGAAHKQEGSHNAHDEHNSWFIFMNIDNFFHTNSLDIKVVDEPSKQHQG
jgi:hypothetical protein